MSLNNHLTVCDVLRVHAEYGQLDFDLVKKAMGPNWPKEWDKLNDGKGIFAPPSQAVKF